LIKKNKAEGITSAFKRYYKYIITKTMWNRRILSSAPALGYTERVCLITKPTNQPINKKRVLPQWEINKLLSC
jgi:hypothetical protein